MKENVSNGEKVQRLETVFVGKGETLRITLAGEAYSFDDGPKKELVATVIHQEVEKVLLQRYARPLLELLERHDCLENGREVVVSRDETGSYTVRWLTDTGAVAEASE